MTRDWNMERESAMFEYRGAVAPILADLRAAGVTVESLREVLGSRGLYRTALPVVLAWLEKTENKDAKGELAGVLAKKWAKPDAAPALIREFRRTSDSHWSDVRWAIGAALAETADDTVLKDILEICMNTGFGRAREMVVLGLGNMKSDEAITALVRLLADADVVGHAVKALGKLRAKRAEPDVQNLLQHEKAWVRREARKALARMR
jgi:HEAT repeat protein